MENIIVNVETRHYAKATRYTDNVGCPLYQAVKELFPFREISVGSVTLFINNNVYTIPNNWWNTDLIDSAIQRAKAGEEIKTKTLTLIPL